MTDTPDTPGHPISGDIVSAPDVTGEWLPPAAAALRLGISERTLWRHVNAGRYHKRITSGRAEILTPEGAAVPDNSATPTGLAVPDDDRQMSLAIIEELRRRLDTEADRQRRLSVKTERQAQEIGRLQAARAAAEQRAADLAERLRAAERPWWRKILG
jgi:hypothetical protein